MVDCNVNQPMISDKERKESAASDLILPIASISTNPQISVTQQSPRSPPPVLLDNFKNGNTNGSQHNLHVESHNGHGFVKKVHNSSPTTQKKNVVTLTNLPKLPPVDVAFNDISFSVSEGRRKGYKTILKGVRLSYLPQLPPIDVGFIDITYTVGKFNWFFWREAQTKTILKEVSGLFRSGELSAIMGPSGSGKSSLMNVLAGYRTSRMTGTLLVNGRERNADRFQKLACYIMQDDCLISHLSVQEAMMVAAALKLHRKKSMLEKKLIVADILEAIGLSDATKTRTLDLSGGQRKRLSIALELVNNPPVMFCDEPTSGLDSSSCFQLLSLLEALARGGRTIVCTIHQPSARLFEKFDHLYMLAEGQCIYQGHRDELVPFLASFDFHCPSYHNPADYVLEVASGEYGDAVEKLSNGMKSKVDKPIQTGVETAKYLGIFKWSPVVITVSTESLAEDLPAVKTFQRSCFTQFWVLLKRSFKTTIRNKQLMHLRIISHIIVGCFIGMIYYNVGTQSDKPLDNLGCIFFTILFITFTGMMPTILTFPMEMGVFIRENLNSWYSVRAFYCAKTFVDIPFQILFTGVYVIAMYYLTAQPTESKRVVEFAIICILTSLVSQSLGLLMGAGLSIEAGVFIGPVSNVPLILFSGFLVRFNTIPTYLRWLSYVSYLRYGFEGAVLAIYDKREPDRDDRSNYYFRDPKTLLKEYSMDESEYYVDVVVLLSIFLGLRIIAYFEYHNKNTKRITFTSNGFGGDYDDDDGNGNGDGFVFKKETYQSTLLH